MKRKHQSSETAYLVDLTCNCNCFVGTEEECHKELDSLVNDYGHDPRRYVIRFTRFD